MNCQNSEQDKIDQQKTLVSNIGTKKEPSNVGSEEEDKRVSNMFDDIHEVLSQTERQVLLTLVELNKEQNATSSPKKYKKYLKVVQTSLKTIEMIKSIKQL